MEKIIHLNTISDRRGKLTVIENNLPFQVSRIFYIYQVDNAIRGGHRHHKTRQAAICINGNCKIYNNDGCNEKIYLLDSPDKCLLIEPEDWHEMYEFSQDAILLVFASELYNKNDYIHEPYPNSLRRPKNC
jgi:dTDP-4-dehydrorhamnose 3,5-epimerase-like enzyme